MKNGTLAHTSREPDDGAGELRLDPDSLLADLNPTRTIEGGAMNESESSRRDDLRLAPRRPPGRWQGKARAFAGEIGRLHAEGYTFEAIREALADVGVVVSNTTVQREVARLRLLSKPPATVDAASLPG
ncbi:MAG: hypothetical protein AB7K09_23605 [Planctomycetota bacterium]